MNINQSKIRADIYLPIQLDPIIHCTWLYFDIYDIKESNHCMQCIIKYQGTPYNIKILYNILYIYNVQLEKSFGTNELYFKNIKVARFHDKLPYLSYL